MTKLATFAALKNYQLWDVVIGNNYYNGRYADYGFKTYPVIASSAEQARHTVLEYADAVLTDLKTKPYNHNRKLLPPRTALAITENSIGPINQRIIRSTAQDRWKQILSPEGWVQVQLTNSRITNWRKLNET